MGLGLDWDGMGCINPLDSGGRKVVFIKRVNICHVILLWFLVSVGAVFEVGGGEVLLRILLTCV